MSEPIYVSKVIQKTMIGVEEKGITVAAIIMVGRSGRIRVTPVPQFIADHSFLFFLGDLEAGLLLLQGRIVDPTKNASYLADNENETKMWKTHFYDGD